MIDRNLLTAVTDQDSLVRLLQSDESKGGLGWPIDLDQPFTLEPEIASGVKGDGQVTVSRLVPSSANERHLVLLAEFERPYVRRDLRELLASLRRHIRETARFADHTGLGDTIFIVASPGYEDIRFVLFEEHDRRLPRIRSFGWRKEFVGRTVLTHNLERLTWSIRDRWERAWDVEGLTESFYKDYEQVFAATKALVTGAKDDKQRHEWTQLLFNRILFIAFVQRMGWLQAPDKELGGYLFDLYAGSKGSFKTFLGVLRAAFDELDTQDSEPQKGKFKEILGEIPYLNGGLFDKDDPLNLPDIGLPDEAFAAILAEPHGLFARYNFTVTESTPLDQEVAVDPEMLGKIFERIIIAEERHKSGTYYTPRPIVEFMVNEALKGYLTERGLPAEKAAMLVDEDRVEPKQGEDGPAFKPSELQDTLDWLFEVRAVDPACGSGAYLLMLLQRLFELVDRIEVSRDKRRNPNQKHLYETKLQLLQRCVYGVDLGETAVRIARLRMWLSLVVENRGEKPDPLPNFDFLIMCGDSLASPVKPTQHVLGYPHVAIRQYTRLKARYFHPKLGEQRPTKEEMQKQRNEIAEAFKDELGESKLRSLSSKPFDWEIEFAEVFDPQDSEETVGNTLNLGLEAGRKGQGELAAKARRHPGFDIVLANPPYVNSGELLRSVGPAYKQELVSTYPKTATGNADLLVYFFDRAMELLKPGGYLAFITSNKWLKAAYGQKLRGQLAARMHVDQLIDFNDLPVFAGVIAYPLITLAQKTDRAAPIKFTSVTSKLQLEQDIRDVIEEWGGDLAPDALGKDGTWRLESGRAAARLAKMRSRGIPLGEYVKGKIYRGVLTGLNEVKIGSDGKMYGKSVPDGVRVVRKEGVFVIDGAKRAELIAEDPKSAEIIKPLAIGRDIKRWTVELEDRWLVFTRRGIDIEQYPAVKRHLQQFRERLEPRPQAWDETRRGEWAGRKPGAYKWYEIQDDIAYWREFDKSNIIWPVMVAGCRFALTSPGCTTNDKGFIYTANDLWLLGVLNSSAAWTYLVNTCSPLQGNTFELRSQEVARLPIVEPHGSEREQLEGLVAQVLQIRAADHGADVAELEADIDRLVEFLYFGEGDSYEDALAKDAADIRILLRPKLETATLEFKETLYYDIRLNTIHGDRVMDVAKAICAMLNRDGGTILIGVTDDAEIVGLDRDLEHFGSPDKFQRKLTELFGVKLRPDPTDLVRVRFIPIDGKLVCRVDVEPDRATMFTLNDKVYVRGPGKSDAKEGTDLAHWWTRRQKGEA